MVASGTFDKKKYQREYYYAHREQQIAAGRERYHSNPERGRQATREYRAANPDKVLESRRKYYEKHGKEYARRWRKANAGRQAELKRQHRLENPELFRERDRVAYAKHRERERLSRKRWAKANPEKIRAGTLRRKERHPEYGKQYYRANVAAIRFRRIKKTYGLSQSEYETMLAAQKHCCKICGSDFGSRIPHIDHCHATNTARGLLCDKCNLGLGLFMDSQVLLGKAVAYLTEYSK